MKPKKKKDIHYKLGSHIKLFDPFIRAKAKRYEGSHASANWQLTGRRIYDDAFIRGEKTFYVYIYRVIPRFVGRPFDDLIHTICRNTGVPYVAVYDEVEWRFASEIYPDQPFLIDSNGCVARNPDYTRKY